jgi:MFS family permease
MGTFLMAAGLGLMAAMGAGAGLPQLVGAYLVLGIGYAVINAPISTVAVSSMPRAQAAVAAAVASSGRNVGLVMGIAVLGSIVDARLPGLLQHAAYPVAFTEAVQTAYAAAAVVAVAARIGLDVAQLGRARTAVHEHLSVLPQEPHRAGHRRAGRVDGDQPHDRVAL